MLIMPQVHAQNNDIRLTISDSVIKVRNEGLADVTIEVENNTNKPFRGGLKMIAGPGSRIASKDYFEIILNAGETKFVGTKVYVAKNTQAGNIPFIARLTDTLTNEVYEQSTRLLLPPRKSMVATVEEMTFQLPDKGKTLSIPVRITNKGNTPQECVVVIAFPAKLNDRTNHSVKLTIPEFSDTLIVFTRKVNGVMRAMQEFRISLAGLYPTGDYFSNMSLSVQNPVSKRHFGTKEANDFRSSNNPNSITIGVQNLTSAGEAYYLRSASSFELDKGKLAYSVNVTKAKEKELPILINGTWVNYEHKNLGVLLGNIVRMGEVNLNGRGAEVYYFDTSRHKRISVGFIDKAYNLINDGNTHVNFGKSAWGSVAHITNKVVASSMLVYDEDPNEHSRSYTWVNEGAIQLKDGLNAFAKAGAGSSTNMENPSEQHGSFMVAAGINGGLSKKYSISSDNFYSSGYFPGTRRGAFSLNERLNMTLRKTVLWASFSHYNFSPKYFQTGPNPIIPTSTITTNLSVGISPSVASFINLSISPAIAQESGSWSTVTGLFQGELKSWGLNGSLNVSSKKQSVSLRVDVGQHTSNLYPEAAWHMRGNFNWNYSFIKFSATAQKGDFLLSDVVRSVPGIPTYRIYLAPSLSRSFLRKKLTTDAGVSYYNEQGNVSMLYTAHIGYELRTTRIFADVQYNSFGSIGYRNIQAGITQLLPQTISAGKDYKCSIELSLFYDYNSNGILDKGDSMAPGHVVFIESNVFITNEKAKVSFTKMPPGVYGIKFPTQQGWYGADVKAVLTPRQKLKLEVGLQRTGILMGGIAYQKDESDLNFNVKKELSLQSIVATNEEGKTILTKTNSTGQYVLYVPAGTYTLSVTDLPAQVECINNNKTVTVAAGGHIKDIDFVLKVKQRKLEVKKFGKP